MDKPVVYQTNRHFSGGIQSSGSFFLCMYHVSSGENLYTELNRLYESLTASGALKDGQPEDYAAVLSAFGINAVFSGTASPVTDFLYPGQFAVACTGPGYAYWVCVDRNKRIIYNPDPESGIPEKYTLHTLKVFTYNK